MRKLIILLLLGVCLGSQAQDRRLPQVRPAEVSRFFNLTADEVKVDTLMPHFGYSFPLGENYRDSIYSASIVYPEFIDMSPADIAFYESVCGKPLPELPEISQGIGLDRKRASYDVDFCPLVFRDGRYQILVSFMLKLEAKRKAQGARRAKAETRAGDAASRYAAQSVLATGKWAKIRVPSSGVYQLTSAVIQKAGFTDLGKVKIYGYGGNLQNEVLREEDLIEYDDLKEVPTCTVDGRKLFYAKGSVSWTTKNASRRTRNPYSDYGYYFITQSDAASETLSEEEFLEAYYPTNDDYHTIFEEDAFSYMQGGRNLYGPKVIYGEEAEEFTVAGNPNTTSGTISVNVAGKGGQTVEISLNGEKLGEVRLSAGSYDSGGEKTLTKHVDNLKESNVVSVKAPTSARLDYISIAWDEPLPAPDLHSTSLPAAEYVYNITNQNHHADGFFDMVIIIPTTQKLLKQAERLKTFHEQHDGLRVKIVPADELYNEFASGTPDANAYRRYLKMLYDRAETEADMPKYLLLFGDGLWDNRMLTSHAKGLNPDDFLLCFESENSFSETECYVDDNFYCLLDDGEGGNLTARDKPDMAVGRFPVTEEADAKIIVDKTIAYVQNKNAGGWQNVIMVMGDDGNGNAHMNDANRIAEEVLENYPGYYVKKVMWDAYPLVSTSAGNTYPDVTRIIKQQQANGALIMNYSGHGRPDQISHEKVLLLNDFEQFKNVNMPLWITASCDIMPFDGTYDTIGETSVLSPQGGAVAFFGTCRTVFQSANYQINRAFTQHVLSQDAGGKSITIGEAQRLAKIELITKGRDLQENKLQYQLLGDPAISLNQPTLDMVVDEINGKKVSEGQTVALTAGSIATIKGHVKNGETFTGMLSALVRDNREQITCRLNDTSSDGAEDPFVYYDRTKVLFNGNDSVRAGQFEISFAVPMDINYSGETGLLNLHAVSNDRKLIAHGACDSFTLGGGDDVANDSIGPSIYCYLNSPTFTNGGRVNSTPYFVAQVKDEDGINATGNGVGHDLELIIDGQMSRTYSLNDYFSFDFGTYMSGSLGFSIPELSEGEHRLLFRAWDILNNSSTAELTFNVVKGLEPNIFSIGTTNNPARTSTTFIINHDRMGSTMDVEINLYDTSGRQLWRHEESGVSTDGAYTVDWDLTVDNGNRLQTGVYIYRVGLSTDGSSRAYKAKKLIVIGNN